MGCRATCVAYMIYEAGKQMEVKKALKEAEHRSDIVRYYVDKRSRWMKQMAASRKWSMLNKRRK